MDLRQLNALVAVSDHRSFSAAARALHTVQSNVSTHVARLERELGATLVDRASGQLTDEGGAVVARARRIQAELAAIDADVAALRDEVRGSVWLGMIGTTARWLVPDLLDAVSRHPGVRLIVVDATTTSLLPQLADGRLELALIQMPITHPDLGTEPIFLEDAIVVAPAGHPLASCEQVDIVELSRHPLLLNPPGIAFRDAIDAAADQAGVRLRVAGELDGMRLLASLAFQGFAPAVVPATAAAPSIRGGFACVPVTGLPRRQVGLAASKRTSLSAPARLVRELLLDVIRSTATDQPGVELADPPA